MPLMPKRVKYRKSQRGSRKGTASRNLKIDFGEFGLQTLERAWITNTQLEAARVALTRNMKRKGKLWIRIFPDKSVTSRPPETRMGKGKGQPDYWVATVPGSKRYCRSAPNRPRVSRVMAEQDQPLPSPASPQSAPVNRSARKTRTGEVISSSMNKTIVVRTVTRVPHPKFGKIVKQMKRFYVHDEENQAKTGDTVRIMETRPLSKLKRWRLVEVVRK